MYGKGTFIDSRLDDSEQYPVAAKAGWDANAMKLI